MAQNETPDWRQQIRDRFPDWLTSAAILRFIDAMELDDRPYVGDIVSGEVISRAPFGVWVDIHCGFPALLLVPNMLNAQSSPITFDDFPQLHSVVHAEIVSLGVEGEIGLIQIAEPNATST